jgi:D-lactate dehydrogenase
VTIYFVAIEAGEQPLYAERLNSHELVAVPRLAEVAADAEIVSVFLTERIDEAFLTAHPRLRLVATRSASFDHVDVAACMARGIAVCHVPEYSETAVAEHTFALILALARRLREVMAHPRGGGFSYEATRGSELHGKTLGLIGMGRIGRRVAELGEAFAMRILASDIRLLPDRVHSAQREFVPLETLLAESDVISLHANLTPETFHILNRETLAQTRRGVLIINTARGALVDTEALRDALETGQVGGAGLDVLQDERLLRQPVEAVIGEGILRHLRSDTLAEEARDADRLHELQTLMLSDAVLSRPNVVFTPHVAFNTAESMQRLAIATCENIAAFIAGVPVRLVQREAALPDLPAQR